MEKPKLIKVLRVAAALSSFGLIASYVSCRAAGERDRPPEPQITADPASPNAGPAEPSPAVFPGSKSAEIEFLPASPPRPAPQPPPPKQREVMPGSKSAPIDYPK